MKAAIAGLLLAPGLAAATCFVHPDTGTTYCTRADECPGATSWNPSTQQCTPTLLPPTAPRACYIEVIYPQGAPHRPQVDISEWCSTQEAAQALAVLTAQMLGAPPYP